MIAKHLLPLLTLFALPFASPAVAGADAPRPNIIVILADDLGYGDLSCFGQEQFETPRLDRMAREGMKLTSHYAASAVCLPSRYSMLTGLHQGHAWIRGNRWNLSMRPDPLDRTFASILQDAGYKTALIGKSGVGNNDDDPQGVLDKGFDYFFGHTSHRAAHRQYPPKLWRQTTELSIDGNEGRTGTRYAGNLFVDEAIQYINEHGGDQPFLMQLSFTHPHPDLAAPEEFVQPLVGKFDEPESQPPADPTKGYRYTPHPKASYAGMIVWMDDAVGRVLDALEAQGIAGKTLVIFTSDNGPPSSGQANPAYFDSNGIYRGHKYHLYEGGIRVPTIAWWPGTIEAGSVSDRPSGFWDYLPTFAELAGAPVPKEIDGLSLVPTLLGTGEQPPHEYLYWELHERSGQQAVRMGKWKGVRLRVRKDPNGPIELYDLERDPSEMRNVAADHPEVVAKLAEIMAQAREPSDTWTFGR